MKHGLVHDVSVGLQTMAVKKPVKFGGEVVNVLTTDYTDGHG